MNDRYTDKMLAVKGTLGVHCPLIFLHSPPPLLGQKALKPLLDHTLHLKDNLFHLETTLTIGKLLFTLRGNLFFCVCCLLITAPPSGGHRAYLRPFTDGGPSDSSLPSIILELGKFLKYLAAYPEASLIKC